MICPKCKALLKNSPYEKEHIDLCKHCGGIWFEKGELLSVVNSLISKNKVTPQSAKESLNNMSKVKADLIKNNRTCPRCSIEMETFNYAHDSNVFLDKCRSCEGIWTDHGELEDIARHVKGNEALSEYAEALLKTTKKHSGPGMHAKVAAIVIATLYLTAAALEGGEVFLKTLIYLILPLACIFYGKELGSMTGIRFRLIGPVITKPTPGVFVSFMGWVLLVAPIFIGFVYYLAFSDKK